MLEPVREMDELSNLINERIAKLRMKLQDTSRRNPLINNVLSSRTSAFIRIVDEKPQSIVDHMCNKDLGMQLVSLPSLDLDPTDEDTSEFKNAVQNALITDEEYLEACEAIDFERDENAASKQEQAIRNLKDRLRPLLGLPDRPTSDKNVDLVNHAKSHGINPATKLPEPTFNADDDRHEDELLQTLLLPKTFHSRMAGIQSKLRSYKEERGIDVGYLVLGYLKWTLPNAENGDEFKSPLLLIPVDLTKSKTSDGEIYTIAKKDDVILNPSLLHKLNTEAALNLKSIETSLEDNEIDVEKLFKEIDEIKPKNMCWSVHREATFGVYPFQGIDLYNDLNPEENDFSKFSIVSQLMLGKDNGSATGDEISEADIDRDKGNLLVPKIVMDADSSQFLALMKVANGNNVALEGPPGSGKSQTIVNAIANSINKGKKVLFVAQKNTALEVVYSRLQALGLHHFVLPLMGDHSKTDDFYDSIEKRLGLSPKSNKKYYREIKERAQVERDRLSSYINTMTRQINGTNLSVHEVLGLTISYSSYLDKLPISIRQKEFQFTRFSDKFELSDIYKAADQMEELANRSYGVEIEKDSYWANIDFTKYDLDKVNSIVQRSKLLIQSYESNISELTDVEAEIVLNSFELDSGILAALYSDKISKKNMRTVLGLIDDYGFEYVNSFFEESSVIDKAKLGITLSNVDESFIEDLESYTEIFDWYLENGNPNDISLGALDDLKRQMVVKKSCLDQVRSCIRSYEDSFNVKLDPTFFSVLTKFLSFEEIIDSTGDLLIDNGQSVIKEDLRNVRSFLRYFDKNFRGDSIPDLSFLKSLELTISKSNIFRKWSSKYRDAVSTLDNLLLDDVQTFTHAEVSKAISELIAKVSEYAELIIHDVLPNDVQGIQNFVRDVVDLLDDVDLASSRFNIGFKYFIKVLSDENTRALVLLVNDSFDGDDSDSIFSDEYYNRLESDLLYLDHGFDLLSQIVRVTDDKSLFSVDDKKGYLQYLQDYVDFKGSYERLSKEFDFDFDKDILSFDFDLIREVQSCATSQYRNLCDLVCTKDLNWIVDFISTLDTLKQDYISSSGNSSFTDGMKLSETFEKITNIVEDQSGFSNLITQRSIVDEAERYGFGNILNPFLDLGIIVDIPKYIIAIISAGLISKVESQYGTNLLRYDGLSLGSARKKYQKFDRELISLSSAEVAQSALSVCSPPVGVSYGRKSEYTEKSLLSHELQKKRRTSPAKVIKRAQNALMELFPCWMMVPTGVARSLPREELFDVVIIDEASQMTPEHSISALMRGKSALIAGDTNQLPPTNFFKGVSLEEDDEDIATVEESILELANINFHPKHRLLWHYRSRHENLISFSNHYVYDSELVVFPSPNPKSSQLGISLVQVDGIFQRGINPKEAQVMTDAIVEFMRSSPERSLGVAVMNQSQQEQLEAQVQQAAYKDKAVSRYIEKWTTQREGLEKFFIKNLENVQGDERDVIFIGTVYGRDAQGKFYQKFGPINGASGKRRLNVLFTRAKEQIVTFSSIPMDHFSPSPTNVGSTLLRRWLEFCATGRLGEIAQNHDRAGHTDSPFEDHVIEVINSLGYEAVPQVGVSSYFIDIGVKHPSYEFGYICGVECDGASYHSSKSARDRDRLREEVLNRLGWDLYRIWSTDWFRDVLTCRDQLKNYLDERLSCLVESLGEDINRESSQLHVRPDANLHSDSQHQREPSIGVVSTHNSMNDDSGVVTVSDKFIDQNTKFTVKYLNGPRAGTSTRFWFSGKTNDLAHAIDGYVSIGPDSPLGEAVSGAELNEICAFAHGDKEVEVEITEIE
tara:strand:- start:3402 stop:8813 length:5412 start_codon:yes stop_codon:yes gene_type:complete